MTREEAIKILSTRDTHGVLCGYTSGYTEALDMAIKALSAEVIEVVRCKDCAYWADAKDYDCEIHSGAFGANDFCSYGERREDGEA